jgi:hypothetical protein
VVQRIHQVKNNFLNFYQRHEVLVSIGVFVFGFLFDIFTLGRIDDFLNLAQEGFYLLLLGALLVAEIKVKTGSLKIQGKLEKFWNYHNLIVHFLFGSLLSAYTIFYYTSASAFTGFLFISLLAGLMLANEFQAFQKVGLPVRVILYSICVLSYFAFLYPIILGRVGPLPFWLGFLSSLALMTLIWQLNFKIESSKELLHRQVLFPSLFIHLFFLGGYYFSFIPPVPVAVKKIGVYYGVVKVNGQYQGKHLRSPWKPWQKGSQDFYTRPGDKVTVLLSIFSPTHFQDKVFLRWWYNHPQAGWRLEDTIPLTILGGRDEGFRGFGSKQNYSYGPWKVIIETSDGREVGRINLEILPDPTLDERIFKIDSF